MFLLIATVKRAQMFMVLYPEHPFPPQIQVRISSIYLALNSITCFSGFLDFTHFVLDYSHNKNCWWFCRPTVFTGHS